MAVDNPVPCKLCGGHLKWKYHDAFSTDSSFDYVGCSDCDLAFMDEDTITDEVIRKWNVLNA